MVTAELEALRRQRDEEMTSSSGERAMLRCAASRLNIEITHARAELRTAQKRSHLAEKSRAELQKVGFYSTSGSIELMRMSPFASVDNGARQLQSRAWGSIRSTFVVIKETHFAEI